MVRQRPRYKSWDLLLRPPTVGTGAWVSSTWSATVVGTNSTRPRPRKSLTEYNAGVCQNQGYLVGGSQA